MPINTQLPDIEATGIVRDLMGKVSSDVEAALHRTLAISPQPHLAIVLGASAPLMAALAFILNTHPSPEPDPDCMMMGALLMARIARKDHDPVGAAYADFEALRVAGRFTPGKR